MNWVSIVFVLVTAYFFFNAIIAATMANDKKEFWICLFAGIPLIIIILGAVSFDDWRHPEEDEGW